MKLYLRALVGETVAVGIFLLGLTSSAITFLPALGIHGFPPRLLMIGTVVIIMAFMFANYKLHSKQQTRIDNLQSKLRKPVPADVERDVDALRHALLQFPLSPIGNHINAEIVAQGLGWDLQRLTAVALKGHWGLRHSRCEGVFR